MASKRSTGTETKQIATGAEVKARAPLVKDVREVTQDWTAKRRSGGFQKETFGVRTVAEQKMVRKIT